MSDNALPLYLSRPLSRLDYGMGKLLVLLAPLSAITWMPALLLALLQYGFDGAPWWAEHGRAVWATVAGSWALPTIAGADGSETSMACNVAPASPV